MANFPEYLKHSVKMTFDLLNDGTVRRYALIYSLVICISSFFFGMTKLMPYELTRVSSFRIIYVIGIVFAGVALLLFAFIYLEVRLVGSALKAAGLKTREYDLGIKFFLSRIYQILLAGFLWMDKRFLIVLAGLVAFGISAIAFFLAKNMIAASVFALLCVLTFIPYIFLIFYSSIKLNFSNLLFLCGESFFSAPKRSWSISHGRTFLSFLVFFAGSIPVLIVYFLLSAVDIIVTKSLTFAFMIFFNMQIPTWASAIFSILIRLSFVFINSLLTVVMSLYMVGMFHYVMMDSGLLPKALEKVIPSVPAAGAQARQSGQVPDRKARK